MGCTQELKRRYFADDSQWLIEEGSVLDREFLARLGQFDVVYSWGVLHHTGAMWQALDNVAPLVAGKVSCSSRSITTKSLISRYWVRVSRRPMLRNLLDASVRLYVPTLHTCSDCAGLFAK